MILREKFNVSPRKVEALLLKIRELKINLADIEESISRGGGRGGQKINKTSNKVRLYHIPTGLAVTCQRERARNVNRFLALRELVDKIEEKLHPELSKRLRESERIRKQKARRKRRWLKRNIDNLC